MNVNWVSWVIYAAMTLSSLRDQTKETVLPSWADFIILIKWRSWFQIVSFCSFGISKICKSGHETSWSQKPWFVKWQRTARDRKNKRTARMLANARKDHSIPLHHYYTVSSVYKLFSFLTARRRRAVLAGGSVFFFFSSCRSQTSADDVIISQWQAISQLFSSYPP